MACRFHSGFPIDQGFEDHYIRPHIGLGGQTPYERKKEKTNSTNPDIVVKAVGQFQKRARPPV
jgi:hypothetical protein